MTLILIIICCLGLVVFAIAVLTAPEGFEDGEGFHAVAAPARLLKRPAPARRKI